MLGIWTALKLRSKGTRIGQFLESAAWIVAAGKNWHKLYYHQSYGSHGGSGA